MLKHLLLFRVRVLWWPCTLINGGGGGGGGHGKLYPVGSPQWPRAEEENGHGATRPCFSAMEGRDLCACLALPRGVAFRTFSDFSVCPFLACKVGSDVHRRQGGFGAEVTRLEGVLATAAALQVIAVGAVMMDSSRVS